MELAFKEKNNKPTTETLKKMLGESYLSYQKILESTSAFKNEWHYYKSSGWIQKFYDTKKALCYFIPLDNLFKINLTIRENERAEFLGEQSFKSFHQILRDAKKYPEGYAVYFTIENKKDAEFCNKFLKKVISMR